MLQTHIGSQILPLYTVLMSGESNNKIPCVQDLMCVQGNQSQIQSCCCQERCFVQQANLPQFGKSKKLEFLISENAMRKFCLSTSPSFVAAHFIYRRSMISDVDQNTLDNTSGHCLGASCFSFRAPPLLDIVVHMYMSTCYVANDVVHDSIY